MTAHAPSAGPTARAPSFRGFALAGAAASGVLLTLSFPPFSLIAAPFVALTPLALVVERQRHDVGGVARLGLGTGLVFWGLTLFWIPHAVAPVTSWGIGLYVAVLLVLAGFVALFAWTTARLRDLAGLPLWLAVPLAWTACEWLRAHMGPFAFPWLELGTSLAPWPTLLAPAEVVGVRGLSFWLAAVSGLTASAWISADGRRRPVLLGWILVAVTVPALWGAWRNRSIVLEPVARVAVFQPGVSRELGATDASSDSTLARIARLLDRAEQGAVDIGVWPEAAVHVDPRSDSALGAAITRLVREADAPVLLGAYLDEAGAPPRRTYNGALLWTPDSEADPLAYRKHRLVPGVESVPLVDRAATGEPRGIRGFARGEGPRVLELEGGPSLLPLICFESAFSRDVRSGVRAGARLLVNMTNDAWFGARADGRPTVGMRQHAAHAILRAVETRTPLARAANTGITMIVDPIGRVTRRAEPYAPEVRVDTVRAVVRPTLFVRAGDVVGTAAAAVTLLLVLTAGFIRGGGPEGGLGGL